MDILNQIVSIGSQVIGPLFSIASSVMCNWYKENTPVLIEVGQGTGFTTKRTLMVISSASQKMDFGKFVLQFQGAPRQDNSSVFPDGRRPSLLVCVAVMEPWDAPESSINLTTADQAYIAAFTREARSNPFVGNGGPTQFVPSINVGIISEKKRVINAWVKRSYGFDFSCDINFGWKNGAFPGNMNFNAGDRIRLLTTGTWNYTQPAQTDPGVYGFITGTFSWSWCPPGVVPAKEDVTDAARIENTPSGKTLKNFENGA